MHLFIQQIFSYSAAKPRRLSFSTVRHVKDAGEREREREGGRERHRDRQTVRQTDKQRERCIDVYDIDRSPSMDARAIAV